MKSVLISIRPKWIQAIFDGEKTLEIRKTRPKIEPPFRCYIYCTNGFSPPDSVVFQKGMRGYIVGEFVCDEFKVIPFDRNHNSDLTRIQTEGSCLTAVQVMDYLKQGSMYGVPGFGWHISALKVYEKPKPLSDFHGPCGECDGCDTLSLNNRICLKTLKRAPQSWGYVQSIDVE